MLEINTIKSVVSKLGKEYGINNAYLFGSYARGEANESSDVDIIIDRGAIRDYDTFSGFHEALSSGLGKKVDLLTTAGVKAKFFDLIKNDRILLYGA